jgi:hypothetical protein
MGLTMQRCSVVQVFRYDNGEVHWEQQRQEDRHRSCLYPLLVQIDHDGMEGQYRDCYRDNEERNVE